MFLEKSVFSSSNYYTGLSSYSIELKSREDLLINNLIVFGDELFSNALIIKWCNLIG